MRTYLEISIPLPEKSLSDILVAELNEIGFEGFEEGTVLLKAFIEKEQFQEDVLKAIVHKYELIATITTNKILYLAIGTTDIGDCTRIQASNIPGITYIGCGGQEVIAAATDNGTRETTTV